MFKQINYPSRSEYAAICQRPSLEQGQLDVLISDVFSQVKVRGDQALRDLTASYEKRVITNILYSAEEINELAAAINVDNTLQRKLDAETVVTQGFINFQFRPAKKRI